MRIAILEIYPLKHFNRSKMIDAHLRNAFELAKILGADVIASQSDYIRVLKNQRKYDVLILNYSTNYMPFAIMQKFVESQGDAMRVRISNEYDHSATWAYFIRSPYHYIANYEVQMCKTNVITHNTINLNLLLAGTPNPAVEKKYEAIYYGTFRKDRSIYFKRYLQEGVIVSTSPKNVRKFHALGCKPKYIDKLRWSSRGETLNLFKYSLYIEDEFTHTNYNHLANRFYEALRCNVVTLFDVNCMETITRSGLKIDERMIIDDVDDVRKLISDNAYDELMSLQKQYTHDVLVEKRQFAQDIRTLINDLYERNNKAQVGVPEKADASVDSNIDGV